MKNVYFVVLLFTILSCNAQQDSSRKMKPDAFEKELNQEGIQVLDVRTAGEFQNGHIKNALQADWNNKAQFNDRIQYVDKDKPVYVYCLVGGRSAAAADWMRNSGFKKVVELEGGINAWKRADKPIEGMGSEKQITYDQYLESIPKDKITLVDIGAPWCPPCIKMNPVIESLEKNKSLNFQLLKIDAGIQTDVLKNLNIDPIPVFIIYKNGKETWRKQGIVTKEELVAQLK